MVRREPTEVPDALATSERPASVARPAERMRASSEPGVSAGAAPLQFASRCAPWFELDAVRPVAVDEPLRTTAGGCHGSGSSRLERSGRPEGLDEDAVSVTVVGFAIGCPYSGLPIANREDAADVRWPVKV